MILPDGTTLLVDAGDLGVFTGKQEIMPQVPDDSKRPAEWIARYITHFSAPLKNGGAIDYALLTHYDDDHIGQAGALAVEKEGMDYKLTGISHVANLLPIHKLIDRDYPNYTYPNEQLLDRTHIANYRRFVAAREAEGGCMEGFQVGSNEQFRLLKDVGAYPNFEIRNIVGNGKLWTGEGDAFRGVPWRQTVRAENRSQSVKRRGDVRQKRRQQQRGARDDRHHANDLLLALLASGSLRSHRNQPPSF